MIFKHIQNKSRLYIVILTVIALGILLKLTVFKGSTQKLVPECNSGSECELKPVVVLHGLARSSHSMGKISKALQQQGYTVCNVQYPSRQKTIEELVTTVVYLEIQKCFPELEAVSFNFVTHSMGGIIVRQLAQSTDIKIARVVMLSPPNQGSELVDKLRKIPIFELVNGKAGLSLSTDSDSVPNTLGKINFEAGIITGNKSTNPLYSHLIPGADDGKVGVERAKIEGMKDFLIVPHSHSFIMNNDEVIEQALNFLSYGEFQ